MARNCWHERPNEFPPFCEFHWNGLLQDYRLQLQAAWQRVTENSGKTARLDYLRLVQALGFRQRRQRQYRKGR